MTEESGSFYRARADLSRLPITSLEQILARARPAERTARGPAGMLDHRVMAGTGRHDRRRKSIGRPGMDRRAGAVAIPAEAGVLSTCLRARDSGIHHPYARPARLLSTGGARSVAASPRDDQLPDRPEPDRQPAHISRRAGPK